MNILAVIDSLPLAFWSPGPGEMLVLAVVALLLYGGSLPEVARSWGKTFAEFRRGLNGFQSELNEVIYSEPDRLPYYDQANYDDTSTDESSTDDEDRDNASLNDGYDESEYAEPESTEEEADVAPADDDTIIEDKPTA